MTCPFCQLDPSDILFAGPLIVGLADRFPVSPGHALVITKRHIADWFDATADEHTALLEGIRTARDLILQKHEPSGFNIGVNVGAAAGQTVPHLHVHVIPRYDGDVADPRGGVRYVIPEAANYLIGTGKVADEELPAPNSFLAHEVLGLEDRPLIDQLVADLANSAYLDLAVAFVTESGLTQLGAYLVDFLERGGQIRFLTGDYLGVTEPRALRRLIDWQQEYGSNVEVRVFQTGEKVSFHPKAYLMRKEHSSQVSYIGSSNLTRQALSGGVEWNQRIESVLGQEFGSKLLREFESLFAHPRVVPLTEAWVEGYQERRKVAHPQSKPAGVDPADEIPAAPPTPNQVQSEALELLTLTRSAGNQAGLVVMATGLGKTWLAAFDSEKFERVLFVAHREEILNQALETFRKIRPEASFGKYLGGVYERNADVLFASVQTLARAAHLGQFARDHFDYIVVDEFHHAAAATYRRLIDHFKPRFLLGLTATPERSDGGDLLSLCAENLVYRCDVVEGINRELLSPFKYFGVPDEVDFSNIPWRSGRFDPVALEHAVATETRALNAYEQWQRRGQTRTLAFCVSKRHADYMQRFFVDRGCRAVAVHSGPSSAPRTQSLRQLEQGELQVVFAVDMFNEGVDVPTIDTVMMLRPTESKILWLQQFGRGLRKAAEKLHLTVIDYIGNHRSFLQVPMLLLPGAGSRPGELTMALEALEAGELELPVGCSVEYELEALNLLKALARPTAAADQIVDWYRRFDEQFGRRPSASEAWHEGYDPRKLRTSYGCWHGFVKAMGGLSTQQSQSFEQQRGFLAQLEKTPMTKSYKMVTLLAMIALDKFPGSVSIDELITEIKRIGSRISLLAHEYEPGDDSPAAFKKLIEDNPVAAWAGGKGTDGKAYFNFDNRVFATTDELPASDPVLASLVQEICDWRLSQYLERLHGEHSFASRIVCRVSHASGRPILFLPERDKNPGIPDGWTSVTVDGQTLLANFVKVAVNVIAAHQDGENLLPGILRRWFGEGAGLPGSHNTVQFTHDNGQYFLRPIISNNHSTGPTLWQEYMREAIPPFWGMEFSTAVWNTGFVTSEQRLFLLVTLEKSGKSSEHQYADQFLSAKSFHWLSQNRTKRSSPTGLKIANHKANGTAVHLFVRKKGKTPAGKAAPFVYCGEVDFVKWQGDKPITVWWELRSELPKELARQFGVPESV